MGRTVACAVAGREPRSPGARRTQLHVPGSSAGLTKRGEGTRRPSGARADHARRDAPRRRSAVDRLRGCGRSAPHGEILRQASLLITHCGHGTTLKALAAGVPIVCMPMGRDQNDTAARVVHASAGVRLRPRSPAKKIAKAVAQVLADVRYRANARRVARRSRASSTWSPSWRRCHF
jgi:UDP:flavonoid glycosyltransferase YjiC (YdhE family)